MILPFPALFQARRRAAAPSHTPAPAPASPLAGIDAEIAQLQVASVRVAGDPELSRLMTQALADARAERTRLIERDALPIPPALSPFDQLLEDFR